jgi:curli biogenesis system outer membrane secretion channel CsgG
MEAITARFYHVMGTITQLDFTTRHGSNHTAGFYHLIGAITAGFYHVMGAITQLDFTTRHRNNHPAGFSHVIGAITQLDFTKSWEQSHS